MIEDIKIPLSDDLLVPFVDLILLLDLQIENIERVCLKYLAGLKQLEHRFEKIEFSGNIKFINDSKATNLHAVSNAINRSKNIILVLHGLTKNIPSKELKLTDEVKKIIIQSEMKLDLNNFKGKIIYYKSINEIKNLIISEMNDGDTILFSCGGASFNEFKNYKDRGNFFKKIVKEIENEI